jgi:peptide/nickel transport system permease protein
MLSYLIRRLMLAAVTLLVVTAVVYGLVRIMPGDPTMVLMAQVGNDKPLSQDEIERFREYFGLNDPIPLAYAKWLGSIFQGDLGYSILQKESVATAIGRRLWPTLKLSLSSLLITYLFCIPIGLYSTARAGKPDERVVSTLLYMLYSLPSFVAAVLLQMLFAIKLKGTALELPLYGIASPGHDNMSAWGQVVDSFRYCILPVVCYTYAGLAYNARFIRANMQEVIRQDFIRTAKAKGVGPVGILFKHAFRNTLIPLVTQLGLVLPTLLSGSIILETVFSWPGIGKLFIEAISQRDYSIIMGLVLMFSVLTLLAQLLADILYAFVDPRVTYK